jgi:hypothetical protein
MTKENLALYFYLCYLTGYPQDLSGEWLLPYSTFLYVWHKWATKKEVKLVFATHV